MRRRSAILLCALVVGAGSVAAAQEQPLLVEQPNADIDPNVAAALAALRARTDAQVDDRDGWTVIKTNGGHILWSFPPQGNPAYPSVVKRELIKQADGAWAISMTVHCEASKTACDDLVRQFQALNDQMKQALAHRAAGAP